VEEVTTNTEVDLNLVVDLNLEVDSNLVVHTNPAAEAVVTTTVKTKAATEVEAGTLVTTLVKVPKYVKVANLGKEAIIKLTNPEKKDAVVESMAVDLAPCLTHPLLVSTVKVTLIVAMEVNATKANQADEAVDSWTVGVWTVAEECAAVCAVKCAEK